MMSAFMFPIYLAEKQKFKKRYRRKAQLKTEELGIQERPVAGHNSPEIGKANSG